jgi:hypothetical protein
MPNRILKHSICSSDNIDRLSWFEEVLFYRLIVNCDDHGLFDGRPSMIKNCLFPLKENLTVSTVMKAIEKLETVGLIFTYYVEGRPYLSLPTWDHHQTIRAHKSKYPKPIEGSKTSSEIICKQMQADVPVIQSNPNPNPNPNPISATPPAVSDDAVIRLPLNDGTEHGVKQADVDKWTGLYPAVDVMGELRKMVGWLDANPKNRKTKSGIGRFIAGWLSREQDRAKKVVGEQKESSFNTEDFFDKALKKSYQAMQQASSK